jgi:hypothetical protein
MILGDKPLISEVVLSHPTPLPLPLPPAKADNRSGVVQIAESRPHDAARHCSIDEKVDSLHAYRRARGLC